MRRSQLFFPGGCEPVILELALPAFGHLPLCRDPAFALQAMERRIKRSVLDLQDVVGGALNVLGDLMAVRGPSNSVRRISMSSVPCMSSSLLTDSSFFIMVDILP